MNKFNIDLFTVTEDGLTTEASDLNIGKAPASLEVVGEHYKQQFSLDHIERDREGELLAWHYKATNPSVAVKLVVFND